MATTSIAWQQTATRVQQFYRLTKPRVVSLIVFTAFIGMFLAVPGAVPLNALIFGTIGIALVAGAAAAVNCLVEQKMDAVMARTRGRPLPRGQVTSPETLFFLALIGGTGLLILHQLVNPLTMWLTLGTFVGYAIIYTVILKPMTPQNIVIGGASGAMPPVLGWAAVTGEVTADALLLFLIIFAWTPPHFWALGPVPQARIRQGGYADAAGNARREIYSPPGPALHAYTHRRHVNALRDADERAHLSRRRGGAGRDIPLLCLENLPEL